jgi:hypothetical protein
VGGKGGGGGGRKGREMTQTLYAHMNKKIKNKIKCQTCLGLKEEIQRLREIRIQLGSFL